MNKGPQTAKDLALALRCPICGDTLSFCDPFWRCSRGDEKHVFSEIDGVPVLLNPERSMFRSTDFNLNTRTTFKAPPAWALRIGRLLPSPSRDVSARNCQDLLASLLSARPTGRRRILVVGSGDGSASYGALAHVDGADWLETDVSLAGKPNVVCDASDLPFDDGQFDLVVCIAVLEHVLEPQRCVDEMHRVLANDGLIYATTPFMQQVHMGEYDFMRFTHSGYRWLLREFELIESGVATGPMSALIWSIEYFLLSWTKSVGLRRLVKGGVRLLLGWLTFLDVVLGQREAAYDGAGGFYFIGRRAPGATVSARQMIHLYRGADTRK